MMIGNLGVQTQRETPSAILNIDSKKWSYNPFNYTSGLFSYPAAFAQIAFKTTSTALNVTGGGNATATQIEFTVYIDGVFNQYVSYASDTLNTEVVKSITLPVGNKTVIILSGTRVINAGVIQGNFLTKIQATDGAVIQFITPKNGTDRVGYLGDSISVSQTSVHPFTSGSIGYIRTSATFTKTIASYGYGSLELFDLVGTQPKMTAVINNLITYYSNCLGETSLIIQLSTNDYGHNVINAADFQTLYNTFLDQLIAAMPSLKITCITAFARTNEAANGLGSTLEMYRIAIRNAVVGRPYAKILEGSSIFNASNLSGDGIHPSDPDGYRQIGVGLVKSIMNIPEAAPTGSYVLTAASATGFATIPASTTIALGGRTNWTVSLKGRRTREGVNDWFFSQGNTNAALKVFFLGSSVGNKIVANFLGTTITSNIAIIDQKWHTYHVVKEGLFVVLYQDGVNVGSVTLPGDFTGTSDSYVGKAVTTYGQVNVDDLRIFDIALTPSQILADIATVTPTDFTNILAAYNFNGNITDISGKGHNGTLGAAASYVTA